MKLYELIHSQRVAGLEKLLTFYGTKREIAKAFGVSDQVVGMWFKRGLIARASALKAEVLTGGKVKVEELRPELGGNS